MNYLGEYSKNSAILLELLTKDEDYQPLSVDFPPTAMIEHYDENGITEVDSVTLNTMEDGGRYTHLYHIPYEWAYGTYHITYQVIIEGDTYTTKESFQLTRTEDLLKDNKDLTYKVLDLLDGYRDVAKPIDEAPSAKEEEQYVFPSEFQTPCDLIVQGNRLVIRPKQPLKYNHSYMVVLDKTIQAIPTQAQAFSQSGAMSNGNALLETKIITFSSEYRPLYATPLEVRSVIRELYPQFQLHDIYVALRDAGQKAHQLLRSIPDANNSRFRPIQERDETYFPSTKYVLYEASRTLVSGLLVKMLNGSNEEDQGFIAGTGASIQLGDFRVDDKQSGGSDSDSQSPMKIVNGILKEIERELKFWTDAMMGRNARGYAKPISAITRDSAPGPESRDI